MSPIPGEPLDPKAPEPTTSDGRKFKIKVPGLAPPPKPRRTESEAAPSRLATIPGRPVNPNHAGF
jgi:hypothetical protein